MGHAIQYDAAFLQMFSRRVADVIITSITLGTSPGRPQLRLSRPLPRRYFPFAVSPTHTSLCRNIPTGARDINCTSWHLV
jgi:hypothetical protein